MQTCIATWMHTAVVAALQDNALTALAQQAGLDMLPVNPQGPCMAPDPIVFSASSITSCWSADRGAHPVCQQQLDPGRDRGHLPISSGWLPEEGSAEVSGRQLCAGVRPHRSWQNRHCRGSSCGCPCPVSLTAVPCFLHLGLLHALGLLHTLNLLQALSLLPGAGGQDCRCRSSSHGCPCPVSLPAVLCCPVLCCAVLRPLHALCLLHTL